MWCVFSGIEWEACYFGKAEVQGYSSLRIDDFLILFIMILVGTRWVSIRYHDNRVRKTNASILKSKTCRFCQILPSTMLVKITKVFRTENRAFPGMKVWQMIGSQELDQNSLNCPFKILVQHKDLAEFCLGRRRETFPRRILRHRMPPLFQIYISQGTAPFIYIFLNSTNFLL